MGDAALVAAARFGLGAGPGDLDRHDPKDWLREQLVPVHELPEPLRAFPTTDAILVEGEQVRAEAKADPSKAGDRERRRQLRTRFRDEMAARAVVAATSEAPFRERLVGFWTNHFSVSTRKFPIFALAGAYEREAIRPNVTGRFTDLLKAVVRHPAMLIYLDQQVSIGPESRAGKRQGKGLNENLAREILELHTVGVESGYEQADVEAFARVLTGWTIAGPDRGGTSGFLFTPGRHEPGSKTILGKTYGAGGVREGEEVLDDLALHPTTARHVCTRLARHFVADVPPDELVDRLVRTWNDSGGHLGHVAAVLIDDDAAWKKEPSKLKTPQELIVSTARAIVYDGDGVGMVRSMQELGQMPFDAPSPKGWPDVAAEWSGPDAILRRVEWAERVGEWAGDRVGDVPKRAGEVLGPWLSRDTARRLQGAEPAQALALLVASPEFQWR